MKEKDMKETPRNQTFIMYAEKEDGSYGSFETGSYLIENDLDDFYKKMEHMERVAREKLLNNEISPVHYYMLIEDLTLQELAQRSGLSRGKVKKHLTVKGFESTTMKQLAKYASVFNIPPANLFQIVLSSQDKNIKYHFYNKADDQQERTTLAQTSTGNPLVVTARVEELKK